MDAAQRFLTTLVKGKRDPAPCGSCQRSCPLPTISAPGCR